MAAMMYRLKRRIVEVNEETGGKVYYTVIDSEATPGTNGRSYSMSAATFHADYAEVVSEQPQPEPEPEPTPEPEPVPPSKVEPLYATDFESDDLNRNGFRWASANERVSLSTDRAYSGKRSLRFRFGPDRPGQDSSAELRFTLAPDAASAPREVWVEWMWYVPSNYRHRADGANNNKLFTLWAENYSAAQEAQFFLSLERTTDSTSRLDVLAVHGDDPRYPSDSRFMSRDFVAPNDYGKWMQVRVHARIAKDGEIQVWKNGKLQVEVRNYNMTRANGGKDYFRHGYLMGWSNSGYTDVTDFYVDDFKLYAQNPGW